MNVKNADDVPISNSKRETVKLDIKKAKTPYSSTPRPRASMTPVINDKRAFSAFVKIERIDLR